MKSDVKRSKPWSEEFLGCFVCVKWPGVLERLWKIGWRDHPTHKKWDRKDCTNYRYIYLSNHPLWNNVSMPNTLMREIANNWTKSGGYAPRVNLVGKLYDQHFLNTFSHIPLLVYSYFHFSFVVRCFVKIKHKYVNIIKRFSVTVTNVANMLHSKNGEVHTGP